MRPSATEDDVRSLQRRAEHAIRTAKPREYIVRLLEQLAAIAPTGSQAERFAHRHLAELRLEESPWHAALHLRRVLQQDPDDDVAQALMGLSQALLANFRYAVACYRRAVTLSPANPWYNHNLGHLLDVALGQPQEALPYLRRAYRLEPSQDEVAASLAHCLGRLGRRAEALDIARRLVVRKPGSSDYRALLHWLMQGAPAGRDDTVPGLLSTVTPGPTSAREPAHDKHATRSPCYEEERTDAIGAQVERRLSYTLASAGRPASDFERARSIWRDFVQQGGPLTGRPSAMALAAAVELALAHVDGTRVRQKDIAARHGVSPGSLSRWYHTIRLTLSLSPNDPRYARSAACPSRKHKKHDDEHC